MNGCIVRNHGLHAYDMRNGVNMASPRVKLVHNRSAKIVHDPYFTYLNGHNNFNEFIEAFRAVNHMSLECALNTIGNWPKNAEWEFPAELIAHAARLMCMDKY